MNHSVKKIAKEYSEISAKRGDKHLFKFDEFIDFANKNKDKYNLEETQDDNDLGVSSWYVDELIRDYRNFIKTKK